MVFSNSGTGFYLSSGKTLNSIFELSSALKEMDESVFNHHVNTSKNDFANWVANSLGDDILKNKILPIKSKAQMSYLIDEHLLEASEAEAILDELPSDLPPDAVPDNEELKTTIEELPPDFPPEIEEKEIEIPNAIQKTTPVSEMPLKDKSNSEIIAKLVDLAMEKKEPSIIEIRKIETRKLDVKKIDRLFHKGLPAISNIIFAGVMSTGKTETAINIALKSTKSAYISLQDTEEKLINSFYSVDNKILDKINSGAITIKKLDTFELASTMDIEPFRFLTNLFPSIVIVDSLSSLRLSFGDNQIGYRHFVDSLFKYFESLGIISISIKELDDEKDLNKEFYENILSDIIITFSNGWNRLKVVKYYNSG